MDHTSLVFIELGSVAVGLAVLARVASRFAFSAIPLYCWRDSPSATAECSRWN